jgi:hypothetical protein
MRHVVAVAALALAGVPAGALAAKPSHPVTPASTNANSNANTSTTTTTTTSTNSTTPSSKGESAKVMFVLRGKVTSYTAGSLLGITLKSSNHERSTLTSGTALTLTLDAKTKVVLHEGAAVAMGDMVVVKIRGAKNASSITVSTTPAAQVVDQGSTTS